MIDKGLLEDPSNLLLSYVRHEMQAEEHADERKLIELAYETRALIVLLDGVDEAAGLRSQIERFTHEQLVPSGNRLVVTSRPEGVTLRLYSRFVVLDLLPLNDEQQRSVINTQLEGSVFFEHRTHHASRLPPLTTHLPLTPLSAHIHPSPTLNPI